VNPSAVKSIANQCIVSLGIDKRKLLEFLSGWSIRASQAENGLGDLATELRRIVPDISEQEESEKNRFNPYLELKRRTLQAFQCRMLLTALEGEPSGDMTVVDIGDSAGTHMLYLRGLAGGRFRLHTISVNLDPRSIKKIEKRGLTAVLCRAEELDPGAGTINLFTSFQMVEHLHNPALFFRRLAVKSECRKMLITVPYLKRSRVGLHHLRHRDARTVFAEDEHIFELSPEDWTLLLLHSGWKVSFNRIYFQYPRRWPLVSAALAWFWRNTDFEGFWGAVLEKDLTFSDLYQDWEDEQTQLNQQRGENV